MKYPHSRGSDGTTMVAFTSEGRVEINGVDAGKFPETTEQLRNLLFKTVKIVLDKKT